MKEKTYIRLQTNETKVYHAASRIYASYVASNQINENNDDNLMKKAIEKAIKLAEMTDSMVLSDDEMEKPKRRGQSSSLL